MRLVISPVLFLSIEDVHFPSAQISVPISANVRALRGSSALAKPAILTTSNFLELRNNTNVIFVSLTFEHGLKSERFTVGGRQVV